MTRSKKILIVDDDPDILAAVSTTLKDNGYETLTAHDGEEGLAQVKRKLPDLILLDLLMPRKSGTKFMDEIKRNPRLNQIPIIILSGASQVTGVDIKSYLERRPFRDRKEAALGPEPEGNVKAYLEKGGEPSELLEVVEKYI